MMQAKKLHRVAQHFQEYARDAYMPGYAERLAFVAHELESCAQQLVKNVPENGRTARSRY